MSTITRIVSIGALIISVNILSGCSGSNGSRPISTTLRAFQVGDYYEYTIRGTATRPEVEPEDAPQVSGTVRVSVSDADFDSSGNPILRFEYITQIRLGEQVEEKRHALLYVQRRDQRDLILTAYEDEQGQPQLLIPDIVALPGYWNLGYVRTYTTPFVYSFAVVGQDWVQTPRGRFRAWRCSSRAGVPPNEPLENALRTVWYAPEIGMPVAAQFQTTLDFGDATWTIFVDQRLSFTTVPIPETNL